MTDTSPIAFVPAKGRKPRGGLGTLILRLFGLTARQRAEYRVFKSLGCKFWFTHPDFAVQAEDAREHYRERLRIMGLDPADYVKKIEEKVFWDYWDSFDPNCGGPLADPVVVVPQAARGAARARARHHGAQARRGRPHLARHRNLRPALLRRPRPQPRRAPRARPLRLPPRRLTHHDRSRPHPGRLRSPPASPRTEHRP